MWISGHSKSLQMVPVESLGTVSYSYSDDLQCNWGLHTPCSTVSFRMTLSDLAKSSMTRSVARSLCNSWASCLYLSVYIC